MHHDLGIGLLLFSVFLLGCSKAENRLYVPQGEQHFSVNIPCHQPKIENHAATFKQYSIPTTVYQCHGLEYAYVITHSRYPVEIYKEYSEQELLDDVVHRLTHRDPPFEFISKSTIEIKGREAVDIKMRIMSPRALYQSKVFFMNDAIYQVAFSSRPEGFEGERKEDYFNSIEIGR